MFQTEMRDLRLERLRELEKRHPGVLATLSELRLEVGTIEELDRMLARLRESEESVRQINRNLSRANAALGVAR